MSEQFGHRPSDEESARLLVAGGRRVETKSAVRTRKVARRRPASVPKNSNADSRIGRPPGRVRPGKEGRCRDQDGDQHGLATFGPGWTDEEGEVRDERDQSQANCCAASRQEFGVPAVGRLSDCGTSVARRGGWPAPPPSFSLASRRWTVSTSDWRCTPEGASKRRANGRPRGNIRGTRGEEHHQCEAG